ncbi:5912_t:CDS:2 [Ambispora gerdemannii]|uniref:5912_t:CDS:1 n=1 Tax=Ambispora gerdemannii TaxID=144530 RepID=A0A9N9FCW0_9GLOM|nr:5912_t:CDS:2 [Ambispora gerdemannii]
MILFKSSSLLVLLLLLTITSLANIPTTNAQCYEHNPLKISDKELVECPLVDDGDDEESLKKRQNTSSNSTQMFQIKLTCGISDRAICAKVNTAFAAAGTIISATLNLKEPVTVNATFIDFCKSMGDCGNSGFLTLGAAPARTIPMQDLDGKQRFYPQALVKQFGYTTHSSYSAYDIVAMFNSVANFWFDGDPPIRTSQSDFLFVIVHELVHGLGFTSSWDDYLNDVPEALTPDLGGTTKGSRRQYQFVEYAFDQYIVVIPQNKNLSIYTDQENVFSKGTGNKYTNIDDFAQGFVDSPQYAVAKQLFNYATTSNSLGFMPRGTKDPNDAIILETSLNPYQQGSSISHVDYSKYTNTSDFLMRYLQDRGVSLQNAVLNGGDYKGGAIGPQLKSVFETLGYATQDNPNPYRPSPPSPNSKTDDSSSSDAPKFNLIYSSLRMQSLLSIIVMFFAWYITRD